MLDDPNRVFNEDEESQEEVDPELAALNALLNHQKQSLNKLIAQKSILAHFLFYMFFDR